MHRVIHMANLPREICHKLIGPQHSTGQRIIVGSVIMCGGVVIAKFGAHFPPDAILHYVMDVAGYFIHGLGAVPLIEWLVVTEEIAAAPAAVTTTEEEA